MRCGMRSVCRVLPDDGCIDLLAHDQSEHEGNCLGPRRCRPDLAFLYSPGQKSLPPRRNQRSLGEDVFNLVRRPVALDPLWSLEANVVIIVANAVSALLVGFVLLCKVRDCGAAFLSFNLLRLTELIVPQGSLD